MLKEKVYIVKIGGNIIDDESRLNQFLKDFSLIKGKKILIHGGGKLTTQLAEKLEIPQQMVDGRRITDSETLKIATMVYAGYCNKNIVAQLQAENINAIGLSGADANVIQSTKRNHPTIDYGFVGDVSISSINNQFITTLLDNELVPVFCAITHDTKGQLLNTNADTIAQMVASSLANKYNISLYYCFEKKGVLTDINNEDSLILEIDTADFEDLKQKEIIHSGMLPKLENAFTSIDSGVKEVVIIKENNLKKYIAKENAEATRIVRTRVKSAL